MDVDGTKERIAEAYRDTKWILALDAAAGATRMVERMRDQGAGEIMIVAAFEGVGEAPHGGPDSLHKGLG